MPAKAAPKAAPKCWAKSKCGYAWNYMAKKMCHKCGEASHSTRNVGKTPQQQQQSPQQPQQQSSGTKVLAWSDVPIRLAREAGIEVEDSTMFAEASQEEAASQQASPAPQQNQEEKKESDRKAALQGSIKRFQAIMDKLDPDEDKEDYERFAVKVDMAKAAITSLKPLDEQIATLSSIIERNEDKCQKAEKQSRCGRSYTIIGRTRR